MKTQRQLLTIIALVMIATAISVSRVVDAQRVNFNKMVFAHDANGQRGATTFEPKDHVIYCIVGISNPSADVKYKFVWSYYDRAQNQRKELFTQELDNQMTNEVVSKFTSTQDLAAGNYTVELYIEGRMRQSRKFFV